MASKPADIGLVNTATIAKCFDLSQRRVQQLVTDGIIDCTKQGKVYRYDLIDTVCKYVSYLREDEQTTESQSLADRKLKAEAVYRELKAEQERIKLSELEGSMHRSEDVLEATEQLVYTIRSILLALPGRLAVDVADCSTAAEASDVIRAEVNAAMSELMQFHYDPEFYAKKVRGREGWRDADHEDEGGES